MTATTRTTLMERRADELRLDIARAAMAIFVADGDTGATVERIAEAAGVAPRTFYRHFAVKEDVVLPLFRRSQERIAAALAGVDPAEDDVETLVRGFATQLDSSRLSEEQRSFLGLMMTNPQYRMRWTEVDGSLRTAICEVLVERTGLGSDAFVLQLTAELVAHAARRAFEEWLTASRSRPVEDLLRTAFGLVLAGLPAEAGGA